MHAHVDDASVRIEVKNLVPGFAAVGRLEKPALFISSPESSQRSDINDVRILGVNENLANLVGLLESHVLPGFAPICRFVDAVAIGRRIARIGLTGSDPDDIGIARGDADVADRHGGLVVELVLVGDAVVRGLQKARRGDEIGAQVGLIDRNRCNAPPWGQRAAGHRLARLPATRLLGGFAGRLRRFG